MGVLNRESIIKAKDAEVVGPIEVPEWGGEVYLRPLSGAGRDRIEAQVVAHTDENGRTGADAYENIRARFVAASVCDEDGTLLFRRGDEAMLGTKSAKALDRLFGRIQEINGLSDKDIEELGKG